MREGGVLGAGSTGAMHTAGATMGHGTGAHAAMATPGAAYGEQAGACGRHTCGCGCGCGCLLSQRSAGAQRDVLVRGTQSVLLICGWRQRLSARAQCACTCKCRCSLSLSRLPPPTHPPHTRLCGHTQACTTHRAAP
jgi:hypothetical protein